MFAVTTWHTYHNYMAIAKFPGYRETYRFMQLLMNLSQLHLVNMGMRCQWCTSFSAQSSYGRPTSIHTSASSKQVLKQTYVNRSTTRESNTTEQCQYKPTRTYTEANSDGFSIAAQPAARAGATFHVANSSG